MHERHHDELMLLMGNHEATDERDTLDGHDLIRTSFEKGANVWPLWVRTGDTNLHHSSPKEAAGCQLGAQVTRLCHAGSFCYAKLTYQIL